MKKKMIFIIIGLLIFLVPYFINVYSICRLLAVLLGLILIQIGLIIDKKDKIWRIVIFPLIFLIISYGLDYGITHLFNRIPIFSEKVVSSKNVVVYNSLFYREYSCGNKIIIDNFYEKDFVCENEDLKELDITSFLNGILENYNDLKDKFVKISGKVSKLNGTYNLELQGYTLTDDSTNGYVLFSDNITLEVNFNKIQDLTNFKVYDSITVIGRIDELIKKGENYIVRMYDSIILESDLYENFELSVVEKNNCENDKEEYAITDSGTYYTSCLSNIFVKYDNENIYDLNYVLTDKKVTLESLISKSLETTEENGNTLYKFDKFKILTCALENEIIIGNDSLELDSPYCVSEEPKTDEEL